MKEEIQPISSFVVLHSSSLSTAGISAACLLELNAVIQTLLAQIQTIYAPKGNDANQYHGAEDKATLNTDTS